VIVYADTSVLAKLLLVEEGTAEMEATVSTAETVTSAAIGYVELRAALAAAIRHGRVPPASRSEFRGVLERQWTRVLQITIDELLLRDAGELAERMRLRAYDAAHLAALRESGSPADVTFACWDAELRRAAEQLGYSVVPK
jgi:predicted nucleic acid-binding protein